MAEQRIGRQTPTQSVVIPYKDTKGPEAVLLYNKKKRECHDWQQLQIFDIMAVDEKWAMDSYKVWPCCSAA